jgi:hypothetical protein
VIRVVAKEYNKNTNSKFPFAFTFIVLPILLHKETRARMPRSIKTYFFVWVEENDDLFFDFAIRTSNIVKFTKEALTFLLAYQKISLTEKGEITTNPINSKVSTYPDYFEYNEIIKKAEMLGKWLSSTTDAKSIYSFFRITP